MAYGDSTRCVHAGLPAAQRGQPVLPGPVMASVFAMDPAFGPSADVDAYGRSDSPTRRLLESAIGELEGGQALTFATGLAAVTTTVLALVGSGDHLVLPSDGYYKIRAWAARALSPRGTKVSLAATTGPYPDFNGARLVLIETPANPGMDVCDIAALAADAHAAGALLAVDNTTATPLGQRPLELGADLVVASGTKALTGHSDMMLGYVASRDEALMAAIWTARDTTGGILGNFDAWLAHRSLATLDLRLTRQSENARAVAQAIAEHPAVRWVRWPGLPGDPGYAIACRQMHRVPGVVTFELAGAEAVRAFLEASTLVLAATSFGGVHTTADRRAQWQDDAPAGLVRLSLGVEDPADLVADIVNALSAAHASMT
jgi:cystathionine gamma-lyase